MELNFFFYNVKGLNSPVKRHKVLKELYHYRANVVFLQETHLALDTNIRLYSSALPVWYYSDSPIRRAKGVAIGFSRSVNFTLINRLADPEGRFLFLKGKLGGKVMTLANVYCPNKNPTVSLKQVLDNLMEFKTGEVVLAGDFNFCLNPVLDSTSRAQGTSGVQLKKIGRKLHQCHIMDVWRVQHAKVNDYTFFSPVHRTYSRLDYIMADHSLLDLVEETRIGITTLSDHAPISMRIRLPGPHRQPFSWKLNESLLKDDNTAELVQKEIDFFFKANERGEIASSILWEAFKAYIRGILISIGAKEKKERSKRREQLIEEIHSLEQEHKKHKGHHRESFHQLTIKREELRDCLERDSRRSLNKITRDRYFWGNKSSKHLARLLKGKRDPNFIERIQNKKGETVFTTKGIAEEFRKYYEALYTVGQKGHLEQTKDRRVEEFLSEAGLTKLAEGDRTDMDRPITEAEIYSALKDSPAGKSPCPDGFTTLFLNKYKETLVPKLCHFWNDLGTKSVMGEDSLSATITLILKEGKNNMLCSSYRPIALLNADTKLYAKVLAGRLKDKMTTLVHPDQVGFVPGREGRDNGVRLLLLLESTKSGGSPALFLSMDAEKTFDRVDWGLMIKTLKYLGVGPRFIAWVRMLYNHPPTSVKVNGVLSRPFKMENGTRQGCPLSPLLFILTLEPLLATIRKNPDCSGIRIGTEEHKLAAYADDVLFYITNPRISIPNLLQILKRYGDISNFKVNLSKSEILNINIDKQEEEKLSGEFHFPWRREIKYLGVKLSNSLKKLYSINYIPLLNLIKQELQKMSTRPLSLFGRVNTIKMVLAPKILYKFQMLPISLPQPYLRALRGLMAKFVWGNKKPRIAHKVLTRGKKQGGLALPDLSKYYKSVMLSRVMEWSKSTSEKRWVNIEHSLSSTHLGHTIWNPPKYRVLSTNTSDITLNTLKLWDQIHTQNRVIILL